jgi:hypothetical protein
MSRQQSCLPMLGKMLSSIRHLGRHISMCVRPVCRTGETADRINGLAQDDYELVSPEIWDMPLVRLRQTLACAVFQGGSRQEEQTHNVAAIFVHCDSWNQLDPPVVQKIRTFLFREGPAGCRGPSSAQWLLVLDFKIVVHAFDACHLCREFASPDFLIGILDDAQQMDCSVRGFHVNACDIRKLVAH